MTESLSTAALLTGTMVGVVALLAFGLAAAARRARLAHPQTLAPVGIFVHVVSIRQSFARFVSRG